MKIVFVVPIYRASFFKGGKGGGEISNQILLEALSERGNSVAVVSMVSAVYRPVYRDGNIVVIEPFSRFPRNGFGVFLSMLLFQNAFRRLLQVLSPDVVIASTSTINVSAREARRKTIPSGAMVRAMENMPGYGWSWSKKSIKDIVKYIVHTVTIGWPGSDEIDSVDFIIANSEFLRNKYLNAFPEKASCVTYPSLDISASNQEFPSSVKKVMMVGVSAKKGFKIFCEIAKNFPDLEFHAIGDHSLVAGETRMLRGVTVHGWYSDPISFIDTMDLVLVPSVLEESFGRISLEALCRRKYVLVSGQGGLPETIGEIEELIVCSHQVADWITRIEDLLRQPEKYRILMLRAIEHSEKFSLYNQSRALEMFLGNEFGFSCPTPTTY